MPVLSLPHDAGWSSQVARRAHNPKVRGSNPLPATKEGRAEPRPFFMDSGIRPDKG